MPSITLNNENIETHYNYITDPKEIRSRVGTARINTYKHWIEGDGPTVLYGGGSSYTCCNLGDFERRGPKYSRSIRPKSGIRRVNDIFDKTDQVVLYVGS